MARMIGILGACLLATSLMIGCGGGGGNGSGQAQSDSSWWGLVMGQVRVASGNALESIHDGTGWMLGKNMVKIEQVGEFEELDGKRMATFRVTVSRSDESFSADIEEIECDELGIPTEQSQDKMDEAVQKIKEMLDKLQ